MQTMIDLDSEDLTSVIEFTICSHDVHISNLHAMTLRLNETIPHVNSVSPLMET